MADESETGIEGCIETSMRAIIDTSNDAQFNFKLGEVTIPNTGWERVMHGFTVFLHCGNVRYKVDIPLDLEKYSPADNAPQITIKLDSDQRAAVLNPRSFITEDGDLYFAASAYMGDHESAAAGIMDSLDKGLYKSFGVE